MNVQDSGKSFLWGRGAIGSTVVTAGYQVNSLMSSKVLRCCCGAVLSVECRGLRVTSYLGLLGCLGPLGLLS
jgi:hypothetical protein